MSELWTEVVGWSASLVLMLTIGRQVWTQWRQDSTAGVSSWLFIGQITASTLFVTYSLLLANWVFVVTNAALLLAAVIGQFLYLRNRHRERSAQGQT